MPGASYECMQQRSVVTQTTPVETEKKFSTTIEQWQQYFFTRDVTPDNRAIVELQRRAAWVALALMLQGLNEINHDWYMPYLMPFGSLIPFFLMLGSFVALWLAFRPARPQKQTTKITRNHPTRWQRFILIGSLLFALVGLVQFGHIVILLFQPPEFSNDGTALDTNAAVLLLEGRNPYADSNMLDMYRQFPLEPNWTTPLRTGQFSNRLDYPSIAEFRSVLDTALKAGVAPEFESKVSYPALSFLTIVPFALFKNYNVLPFYLCSYLVLIVIAWRFARPELRPWVLLLSVANVPMWASGMGGNLDLFYTLLIVLTWLMRDYRWRSAIFLGLALASKQLAWFFIPFYAIMILRIYGWKECIYRLAIGGILGLAINLPFILWNPQAFVAGVLAPVADPMFPLGVGLVGLSITHLIPYFPEWIYKVLEASTMLVSLLVYWRICRKYPESAMLFAVLPLFFAWRSLSSYFYCVAYPILVLLTAHIKHAHKTAENTNAPVAPTRSGSIYTGVRIKAPAPV